MAELPKRGDRLRLDGDLVTIETATASDNGVDLIVRGPNGVLKDRTVSWEQLAGAGVVENDGQGEPSGALAGLWGRWMQYASPRLRSAALATRSLKQFAHQDEAVFDHMLPQPRLRFLLADEPGTGKTIMTGMYLVEGRRRGLWTINDCGSCPSRTEMAGGARRLFWSTVEPADPGGCP
jgi:hypothetical protein